MGQLKSEDIKVVENAGIKYFFERNALQSVDPPESHFGFTYWSLMVPPVKPKRMLQLGCGGHTVPKLIEKIWGKVDLTCNEGDDAFSFVKTLKGQSFDYIVIDLFEGPNPLDQAISDDFIKDIADISTGLVAINSNISLFHATIFGDYFQKVLEKKLNNNVVTFMSRNGFDTQYFAIKL